MQRSHLCDEEDIQALRDFIHRLGNNATIVDFEINILLSTEPPLAADNKKVS